MGDFGPDFGARISKHLKLRGCWASYNFWRSASFVGCPLNFQAVTPPMWRPSTNHRSLTFRLPHWWSPSCDMTNHRTASGLDLICFNLLFPGPPPALVPTSHFFSPSSLHFFFPPQPNPRPSHPPLSLQHNSASSHRLPTPSRRYTHRLESPSSDESIVYQKTTIT